MGSSSAPGRSMPSGRQPAQRQAEDDQQQRADHEGGGAGAERGEGAHQVVGDGAPGARATRGQDPGGHAQGQGEEQRAAAEAERHRRGAQQQIADVVAGGELEAGAEVAVQLGPQVVGVLDDHRPVLAVQGLHALHGRRRHGAVAGEVRPGVARHQAQRAEGQQVDQPYHRQAGAEPARDEQQHGRHESARARGGNGRPRSSGSGLGRGDGGTLRMGKRVGTGLAASRWSSWCSTLPGGVGSIMGCEHLAACLSTVRAWLAWTGAARSWPYP